MLSAQGFLEHLHTEKFLHKEQRHKHVIHKLVLSGGFFGLGQLTNNANLFHLFLYIVPFISLIHDVYIFSEHFKVHRVGVFIRKVMACPPVSNEELAWEKFAQEHPEKNAKWASFAYTILITIFSALAVYYSDYVESGALAGLYYYWVFLCVFATLAVFGFSATLQNKIDKIEGKTKDNNP